MGRLHRLIVVAGILFSRPLFAGDFTTSLTLLQREVPTARATLGYSLDAQQNLAIGVGTAGYPYKDGESDKLQKATELFASYQWRGVVGESLNYELTGFAGGERFRDRQTADAAVKTVGLVGGEAGLRFPTPGGAFSFGLGVEGRLANERTHAGDRLVKPAIVYPYIRVGL